MSVPKWGKRLVDDYRSRLRLPPWVTDEMIYTTAQRLLGMDQREVEVTLAALGPGVKRRRRWLFIVDTDCAASLLGHTLTPAVAGTPRNRRDDYDRDETFINIVGQEAAKQFAAIRSSEGWHTVLDPEGRPNSVAIFFKKKPTPDMIGAMKLLAANFAATCGEPLTIKGFRMLHREWRGEMQTQEIFMEV